MSADIVAAAVIAAIVAERKLDAGSIAVVVSIACAAAD